MTTVPTTQASAASARPLGPVAGFDALSQRRDVQIAAGILFAGFIGLFFRWFYAQHRFSSGSMDDWGHAYFIPGISAYLAWQNRHHLARAAASIFWPGLLPLLLGIVCYVFFCVGAAANHMFQGLSMILTLFGLCLFLLGPGVIRWLFIPIAYLVFAITISERIMIAITWSLQILAAQGAWVMLNIIGAVFGFKCDIDGNVLTMVTPAGRLIPLNVAEACSGMRMVIAFYALGGAVAVLACKHWWQRIALLLLAAPVALFMNIIRVAVLGIAALYDSDLAAGEAHTLIGTLLLLPGLGLFLLVVAALNRVVTEPEPAPAGKATP